MTRSTFDRLGNAGRPLVRRAKALGLNISDAVEVALEEAIREAERAAGLRENGDAIGDYKPIAGGRRRLAGALGGRSRPGPHRRD